MAENREEILANFQSITGIDDVAEAILNLETSNWDLIEAVNNAMAADVPIESSIFNQPPIDPPFEALNNFDLSGNSDEQEMVADSSQSQPSPQQTNTRNIYGDDPSTSLAAFTNEIDIAELRSDNMPSMACDIGSTRMNKMRTNRQHKDIIFNIHSKNKVHKIMLADSGTIGDLKHKIMQKTIIPICKQIIQGWPPEKEFEADINTTVLFNLKLSGDIDLIVMDKPCDGFVDDDCQQNNNKITLTQLNKMYTLNILNEITGKTLTLKFPGKQTYLDIKTDVYTITDVPVRHQVWSGWPPNVTNSMTLYQISSDTEFKLKLNSSISLNGSTAAGTSSSTSTITPSTSSTVKPLSTNTSTDGDDINVIEIDSDSTTTEEFEDASEFNADDEIFSESKVINNRVKNLIPEGTDDETIGCIQFVDNYIERYGEPHPLFYQGSLEDALKEACQKPLRDRKLLAIYLHHDGSVLTNVFCDRLLKCESIMQILLQSFILYGWDLTIESNKNLFLSSISACVSDSASITVRQIPMYHLPSILIVGKSRSFHEVLSVIHGNVGIDELLVKLMDALMMYSDQRDVEVREENERAEREMVKMEQDAAYNESLETDKRKEEVKRQIEYAIASKKEREEFERQEIEAIRESNRLDAEKDLPSEPDDNEKDITKIRVRKPTGDFLERRFLIKTKLSILLKFIASKGFPIDEYKVISSWPRKDLTTIDKNETLYNLKLYPQETVILEER